jgi:Cys-tRNA(Pro)/Cys-tRNA(Cys) deacylase
MAAAVSRATSALLGAGVRHQVHRYHHDRRAGSYGAEAVDALCARLGVHPHRVLKTLVVTLDGGLADAVLPVPDRLELRSVAAALGGRRSQLAERAAVERATGYVLGGVSPLGQRTRLPTVLHSPVMDHPTVLCSGGLRGLEVELAPGDLQRLTDAVLAPITQG